MLLPANHEGGGAVGYSRREVGVSPCESGYGRKRGRIQEAGRKPALRRLRRTARPTLGRGRHRDEKVRDIDPEHGREARERGHLHVHIGRCRFEPLVETEGEGRGRRGGLLVPTPSGPKPSQMRRERENGAAVNRCRSPGPRLAWRSNGHRANRTNSAESETCIWNTRYEGWVYSGL